MTVQELTLWHNEAFLSFDANKIRQFMRYWGIPIPEEDTDFWRMVYSTVLRIPGATREKRRTAELGLRRLEEQKGE